MVSVIYIMLISKKKAIPINLHSVIGTYAVTQISIHKRENANTKIEITLEDNSANLLIKRNIMDIEQISEAIHSASQ